MLIFQDRRNKGTYQVNIRLKNHRLAYMYFVRSKFYESDKLNLSIKIEWKSSSTGFEV